MRSAASCQCFGLAGGQRSSTRSSRSLSPRMVASFGERYGHHAADSVHLDQAPATACAAFSQPIALGSRKLETEHSDYVPPAHVARINGFPS